MQSFYINLAYLLKDPYNLLKELIEKDSKSLSFSFLLIPLVASCQYIGYTLAFDITNSLFSYVIFMILYASLFFLCIFLDSSIINHFLRNNNKHNFNPKSTLTLVSISLYPYLFLPSLAILIKFLNIEGIYCLVVLFTCIWVIRTRFRMLNQYKSIFSISPRSLIMLPFAVQLAISVLILMLFSISMFSTLFNAISNINNLFYI